MTSDYGRCGCGCGQLTNLARCNDPSKGWIKGEPIRFIAGHAARKGWLITEEALGYGTACHVWQKARDHDGYGITWHDGTTRRAHRIAYERAHGPIREGLVIDHLCRVPACVNPDHMQPVTTAENTRRGANAILTPEDVAAIRAYSGLSQRVIAMRHGISQGHVSDIRRGKRWAA